MKKLLVNKGKVTNKTHVLRMRNNIPAESIGFVLMQYFTAEETQWIINEINDSDELAYQCPQFTIVKSALNNTYCIFVLDARFIKLTDPVERECEPPKTIKSSIADITLWDGRKMGEDAEFLLNVGLWCKRNRQKAKASVYGLLWDMTLTLLMNSKQLASKIKTSEGEQEKMQGTKEFYKELNEYPIVDPAVVIPIK